MSDAGGELEVEVTAVTQGREEEAVEGFEAEANAKKVRGNIQEGFLNLTDRSEITLDLLEIELEVRISVH